MENEAANKAENYNLKLRITLSIYFRPIFKMPKCTVVAKSSPGLHSVRIAGASCILS